MAQWLNRVVVAGSILAGIGMVGCAGMMDKLGENVPGVAAAKGAMNAGKAAAQIKALADSLSAEQAKAVANVQARRAKADSLELAAPGSEESLQAQQELLASLEKQKEVEKDVLDFQQYVKLGYHPKWKYGEPFMKDPVAKSLAAQHTVKEGQPFTLPPGKYALITFAAHRQVVPTAHRGNGDYGLSPDMLHDTTVYWAQHKETVVRLWEGFAPEIPRIFEGLNVLSIEEMQANAKYQELGTYKPIKIMGMSAKLEEYRAPGFGYFNPLQATVLASTAEALEVDYLVLVNYSADYAVFDGDFASGNAQLRLQLDFSVVDKAGKPVTTVTLDALSANRGRIFEEEMYPYAIQWLAQETQPALLERLRELRK